MILDQTQTNQPFEEPKFITTCGGKIKDPSKYPSPEYRIEPRWLRQADSKPLVGGGL